MTFRTEKPLGTIIGPVQTYTYTPYGVKESVTSTPHKNVPYKGRKPNRKIKYSADTGGPFLMRRFSVDHANGSESFIADWLGAITGNHYIAEGNRLQALNFSSGVPPRVITQTYLDSEFSAMSFATDLAAFGPTAIHRFGPLNSSANTGQALVELLHDGLPSLPLKLFRNLGSMRKLGKEFLNVEFGWKPLLKDLQDIYHTQQNLNNRLKQIIRDNNRPIRRGGTLRNSITNVFTDPSVIPDQGYPILGNYGKYPPGATAESYRQARKTTTSDKIWFRGRFRYYIPDVTDDRWTDKAKLALFGLNPTPSLLYEVMPWSWLIDWFSNVGDVISNLSSNGIADVILDYGYLMRHQSIVDTFESNLTREIVSQNEGLPSNEITLPGGMYQRTVVTREQKERIAASPFGFGLQIGDLSVRQFAILSALGLSRQNFL